MYLWKWNKMRVLGGEYKEWAKSEKIVGIIYPKELP